jgi:hypothetical protein
VTLDVSLLSRPCTIEHVSSSGTPDDYGTPANVVTSTTETTCELQQRSRAESQNMAEIGQETWFLVLPPGTPITTWDRVVIDGQRFEVVGPPWPVRHPRLGAISHVEATVKAAA